MANKPDKYNLGPAQIRMAIPTLAEQYMKGYREGFDDCKESIIEALSIFIETFGEDTHMTLKQINDWIIKIDLEKNQ